MKGLYLRTFGCQMNERDSERIAGLLSRLNYTLTDDLDRANLIILNTCSIREKSEQKLYSALGRFKEYKERQGAIIGVGGCVAQQEGERLLKRIPFLDIVFGTHNIHRLPEMVREVEEKNKRISATNFYDAPEPDESFVSTTTPGRVKAYVSIMRGCDNYCSYCIVPYVRGREVSRSSSSILKEVRGLADRGIKEVTLIGQNVNSYGGEGEVTFPQLIKMISKIDGIERIRFTTSHPKDLSDELINAFTETEKLCRHIHLPVQSGSNKILKAMKRGYTREEYLEKIDKLRALVPGIAITSDFIVGFPGEDENDFNDTISLLRMIEFDAIFSFKFSPRPMTEAARMEGHLPDEIKAERLSIVQAIQRDITMRKNRALEGKVLDVLVEGVSKKSKDELTGRTDCNRVVNFPGDDGMIGAILNVRIEKAFNNSLKGSPVNLKH